MGDDFLAKHSGTFESAEGVFRVVTEVLFEISFNIPLFVVILPIPIILVVEGGDVVERFGSARPKKMVSEHGVEIEVGNEAITVLDPLGVVIVVLALD